MDQHHLTVELCGKRAAVGWRRALDGGTCETVNKCPNAFGNQGNTDGFVLPSIKVKSAELHSMQAKPGMPYNCWES